MSHQRPHVRVLRLSTCVTCFFSRLFIFFISQKTTMGGGVKKYEIGNSENEKGHNIYRRKKGRKDTRK
jgi:hypothetical protein